MTTYEAYATDEHTAAELLMRAYALSADETYRAWIYTQEYDTSAQAQEFIQRGLASGLNCNQIFELSKSTYGAQA